MRLWYLSGMSASLSDFISRWAVSGGSERANKDIFLHELCDVLGVPRPDPKRGDPALDLYVLEADAKAARVGSKGTGKMDLYRAGSFILEAKQGSNAGALLKGTARRDTPGWYIAMQDAYGQALSYARTLSSPPPFLITCDIGWCFDLYACFDGSRLYRPFPSVTRNRLMFAELGQHVEVLRGIWLDPMDLDPGLRKEKVTREIAGHLADLARSLEGSGFAQERVARFLMRCIFTMFAEDVGLLPKDVFKNALQTRWCPTPESFAPEVTALWEQMNTGGMMFGVGKILHFNGGLFSQPEALPLNRMALDTLLAAAACDWSQVEPSIFGTLLERALTPEERHKLGAHYTPRPYVERLVRPVIEAPLREEWTTVRAAVRQLVNAGKVAEARKLVGEFHLRLEGVRVLDPACGTGNFLYVALDLLKRLEAEVLGLLEELGEQTAFARRLSPENFLGLELKPWAREIADLVLWVGYLSAQLRLLGKGRQVPEPVLRKLDNIQCRDAVLVWSRAVPVPDEHGQPMTRWDGVSMKPDPLTGAQIPDERRRVAVQRFIGAKPAAWSEADYVIGNPPFIGGWKLRQALGDGYAEALRETYPDVPDSADLVMYWWHKAAGLARAGKIRRFGFITTNSIWQSFQRRVIDHHMQAEPPLHLDFAIPDHPWTDSESAAAVRIAMTAGSAGTGEGALWRVVEETATGDTPLLTFQQQTGLIHSNLRIGANVASVVELRANSGVCSPGVKLHGAGFIVTPEEATRLGLGTVPGLEQHILDYRNGRDLTATSRGVKVIDLFGLTAVQVRDCFPAVYQHVLEKVKPEREGKSGGTADSTQYAKLWWQFGKTRPELRRSLSGLPRYIATVETAKHRVFQFLDATIRPDNMLVAIASADAFHLGVLSSRIHVVWALAAGARLGVGNDPRYTKSRCFDPFPFPDPPPALRARIADYAELLDAHRKRQQAAHPALTLTGMYNVLAAIREGCALDAKEQDIHQRALTSILRELHDAIDEVVFEAYGWPADLDDEGILERVVALNRERVAEERAGRVRWLRPALQAPAEAAPEQHGLGLAAGVEEEAAGPAVKQAWPKGVRERVAAVRAVVTASMTVGEIAACFKGAKRADVEVIVESLASVGVLLVSADADPRYSP